ncbi:UbiH/UbiF family hydroxylase [Alphaproteobacteria bacterium GH1-50]|uniref:UbiH/UbiF family hydroxylase n=1 Tax=Kangsaoukella pontilimi TaxID=2691042 RepID=A0A7C9IR88_9RHOB|nr:FAD-dependent monooxygenase [Kangsaoukella pontilimi]MXQ06705.1 UbiH/UbiF family hydroxylase [Kangsaoukella pontilimi]
MQQTDIFISGGGIAGLVTAAGFADLGYRVTLADPAPPPETSEAEGSDLRSTAYLAPACALLDRLGLWGGLLPRATPLETLQVIDSAGDPPEAKTVRAFQAADLGEPAFGWNLPNWLTRKLLADLLAAREGVDLRFGTGFSDILTRDREAIVTLSDGARLRCRLAVAADGRASPLREAVGIDTDLTRYGQKALAFVVGHDLPHENVSTEIYLSGGAFTLVPLPDHEGRGASAVVWMNDGPVAAELMALSPEDFAAAATQRSTGILGDLTLISKRAAWPVVTQRARALTAERTAIVAEAAHVLPPIGAQGLNTSLHDVAALLDIARDAPDSVGDRAYLAAFEKRRAHDIHARAQAIDLFNRVCKSDAAPVQALRSLGLKAVHDIAPLRHGVMRAGLGR